MTRSKSEKPKPKLRDLTRERPVGEEDRAVRDFMNNGPPLASAILGLAMVEEALEDEILYRLPRKDTATISLITDSDGPISTVAQMISLAYAFNAFNKDTLDNLNIARRIRNTFAHAKKLITFDHPLIAAELLKIKVPASGKRRRDYLAARNSISDRKAGYIILCYLLTLAVLSKGTVRAKRKLRVLDTTSHYQGGGLGQYAAHLLDHQILSQKK